MLRIMPRKQHTVFIYGYIGIKQATTMTSAYVTSIVKMLRFPVERLTAILVMIPETIITIFWSIENFKRLLCEKIPANVST